VFEVLCDPEVPPLPHITIEQARSLTRAIMHGDPSRRRIIAQSIRQKLPETFSGGRLVPKRRTRRGERWSAAAPVAVRT
jgi:hypothetical protein